MTREPHTDWRDRASYPVNATDAELNAAFARRGTRADAPRDLYAWVRFDLALSLDAQWKQVRPKLVAMHAQQHPEVQARRRRRKVKCREFYVDCLRALDAVAAGVEPEEIAAVLFPKASISDRRRRLGYRLDRATFLVEHGLA
jgi:hypothetical protein